MGSDSREIKQIRIKPHSDEWHKFRYENGYGGSEIASVVATASKTMGDLIYTPPLKLHLQKIGETHIQEFTGNITTESGHFFEPIILNWFRFFDIDEPDQYKMFQNIKANNRINKVISPKVYIKNEKYPWLFVSPDAWAWKYKKGPKRYVETKHTSSMETKRHPNKISPAFYAQVQLGLMLTELEVADLCLLIDGRWFEVVSIEPSKEWFDLILDTSHKAWRNIIQARIIKLEYGIPSYFGMNPDMFTQKQLDGIALLSELEPPLSGTDSEFEFIKEMVVPEVEEVIAEGSEDTLKLCLDFLSLDEKVKETTKEKQTLYSKMLLALGAGHNVCRYGDQKLFTYKMDKRGVAKLLVNDKIKEAYA